MECDISIFTIFFSYREFYNLALDDETYNHDEDEYYDDDDDEYDEYDDEDDGKTYLPFQFMSTFLKIPIFIQSMMMKSLKGSSEVMTMMTIMTTTMTTI